VYVFEAGQYSAPSHLPSRAIWYFSEMNSTSPPLASRALREAFIFAKTSFILSRFCDVEAEIVTTAAFCPPPWSRRGTSSEGLKVRTGRLPATRRIYSR